jgi:hypothetical protein
VSFQWSQLRLEKPLEDQADSAWSEWPALAASDIQFAETEFRNHQDKK